MMERAEKVRFLNLAALRFPPAAIVSILHRISGVILFFAIPLLLFLIELSLHDAAGYRRVEGLLTAPSGRIILWFVAGAFFHHLVAGVRFLLLDVEVGVEPVRAQRSARTLLLVDLIALLLLAGVLI